ncbi:MAG TPA: glycosyltransferase [Fermentimonas sp.]|jgi:putative colanic acid biosynthesis glycosyltransferase|nr:MAG: glycosyltransferase [Anaerolineaceae bacterium]HLW09800.1 glycosyltransferase [Fermentimonas sp.]
MKKLLQINSVVNSGSTGRIAEEIAHTAIASGWESYIAFGRNERYSESNLIRIGNDLGIKMHGLQTRLFDRHGLGSVKSTKLFIQQVDKIKPDIIHLHNIHGYYINIEILFNYLSKVDVPVVWTLHDCWSITGHCTHFSYVGCEKWRTKCYSCPQKNEYPASLFIDRSEKNYILKNELFNSLSNLTLVPVSQWLSDILKDSFLQKYPSSVINNGINTSVFKPTGNNEFRERYGLQNKFILLGVAGIWSQRKGLEDFIELSKTLGADYQIILVGLTRKQKDQLPVEILGIERTESVEELAELYASSDVYINTTYEDTFPTTNLESLACGTPVITYNTGGSPESIDESTGIVVEQGNISKLVEAIRVIKDNGKQYYSDACVNRVNRLYKKEDRYKEYIDLYESLIK